ncbi:hypothetical protein M5K25_002518 [Dendrobium thyrsiflorum]|uniref:Uncharacterized protein n=1 Tax=Dendrobium thyrsiflorum TaxID=117978 RepID=A0ABD0VUU5_DENTH
MDTFSEWSLVVSLVVSCVAAWFSVHAPLVFPCFNPWLAAVGAVVLLLSGAFWAAEPWAVLATEQWDFGLLPSPLLLAFAPLVFPCFNPWLAAVGGGGFGFCVAFWGPVFWDLRFSLSLLEPCPHFPVFWLLFCCCLVPFGLLNRGMFWLLNSGILAFSLPLSYWLLWAAFVYFVLASPKLLSSLEARASNSKAAKWPGQEGEKKQMGRKKATPTFPKAVVIPKERKKEPHLGSDTKEEDVTPTKSRKVCQSTTKKNV